MQQIVVDFQNVSLSFGQRPTSTEALSNVSLKIGRGEFAAIVGPSGCGKSTILKLAAGLLDPTAGAIFIGGREVAAKAVTVGLAFQNPTMLPWLTIERNLLLPLKIVQPYRSEYHRKKNGPFRERVNELLELVGLAGFGQKFPWQLSGGMLQRANLCRALVHNPGLLLLDEPFGALDQFTREELWGVMQRLWTDRKPTVLLVTHDLREAAYLASRVLVMSARPGRLIADMEVDLDRPRTVDATYEPEAVALCQNLRRQIAGEMAGGAR